MISEHIFGDLRVTRTSSKARELHASLSMQLNLSDIPFTTQNWRTAMTHERRALSVVRNCGYDGHFKYTILRWTKLKVSQTASKRRTTPSRSQSWKLVKRAIHDDVWETASRCKPWCGLGKKFGRNISVEENAEQNALIAEKIPVIPYSKQRFLVSVRTERVVWSWVGIRYVHEGKVKFHIP